VEKATKQLEAQIEAKRGIYADLNRELQQAIADHQSTVSLRRVAPDGSEYEAAMTITAGQARHKPPKSITQVQTNYQYHILVWYQSSADGKGGDALLLAEASKTSKDNRVEFGTDKFHTRAYDRNGDTNIDEAENTYFNFDGDDISNLQEILEGGNAKHTALSFISPAVLSLPENASTEGYPIYTAQAISGYIGADGERLPVYYSIHNDTDSAIHALLDDR